MKKWTKLLGIGGRKPDPAVSEDRYFGQEELNTVVIDEVAAITAGESVFIKIDEVPIMTILPNPFQPRKTFHDDALQELSQSIREFGVLQPLLVRRKEHSFELIAGERRLRASRLAGLVSVPVIIKEIEDKEMAELAMIENLQREDLHYLEEAEGFQQLLTNFHFTQDELARRVGKNQSTIANKLRLLKMPPEIRDILIKDGLTERHARALLKLDGSRQMQALSAIKEQDLNVRETEELIKAMIDPPVDLVKPAKQNFVKIIKDVRIFVNTVNSVVAQMRKSGMDIRIQQQTDEEFVTLQIQVKNSQSKNLAQVKK